jgi:hypothetical protein
MDRGKLFQDLFEAYKIVMNGHSAREAQEAAIRTWNSLKTETKDNQGELGCRIKDKIVELQSKGRKQKATLMTFWCNIPVKKTSDSESGPSSSQQLDQSAAGK